jgi:hypothetical protein
MQKLSVAVTWIAVKIEEQTHKVGLRDLVMVFNVLQQREDGRSEIHIEAADSERVRKVQEEVACKYEMEVFSALGFICHVDHPHKFMTNLLGYIFYDAARKKSDVPPGLAQVCTDPNSCMGGLSARDTGHTIHFAALASHAHIAIYPSCCAGYCLA